MRGLGPGSAEDKIARLRVRHIGVYVDGIGQPTEWAIKRKNYGDLDVWEYYRECKAHYQSRFLDFGASASGMKDTSCADLVAQRETDFLLFRRCRRKGDPPPLSGSIQVNGDNVSILATDFEKIPSSAADFDIQQTIVWVANHLVLSVVEPHEAPNPFAFLLWFQCRKSTEMMKMFFSTYVSKIIPSKTEIQDQRKRRDDGRECVDIFEQYEQRSSGGPNHLSG